MSEIEQRLYVAAAIRNHEGKYLTVYHSKKKEHPWRWAGGKVETYEVWRKALARELKEELNLTVTTSHFLGAYTSVSDGQEWKGIFYVISVDEIDLSNLELVEEDKHTEIKWLTPTELYILGTQPEYLAAIDAESEVLYGRLQFGNPNHPGE